MASAGRFDRRCLFERRDGVADGFGNPTSGGWLALVTVWGMVSDKPGREAVEAGRVESAALAELTIRDSAAARAITPADRVKIDGQAFAIRDVRPPRRSGRIVLLIERGRAQ